MTHPHQTGRVQTFHFQKASSWNHVIHVNLRNLYVNIFCCRSYNPHYITFRSTSKEYRKCDILNSHLSYTWHWVACMLIGSAKISVSMSRNNSYWLRSNNPPSCIVCISIIDIEIILCENLKLIQNLRILLNPYLVYKVEHLHQRFIILCYNHKIRVWPNCWWRFRASARVAANNILCVFSCNRSNHYIIRHIIGVLPVHSNLNWYRFIWGHLYTFCFHSISDPNVVSQDETVRWIITERIGIWGLCCYYIHKCPFLCGYSNDRRSTIMRPWDCKHESNIFCTCNKNNISNNLK